MRSALASVLAALIAAFALVPTSASAQSDGAVTRDQVRGLLSGFEDVPSDATWRTHGDAALPHLLALYQDTTQPPYIRLRAMQATAAFPRPAVRMFLHAVSEAPRQSDLFVRSALLALVRGFGASSVAYVRGFLVHDAVAVRSGAAIALDRVHSSEALSALRARLPDEPNEGVRARIRSALR